MNWINCMLITLGLLVQTTGAFAIKFAEEWTEQEELYRKDFVVSCNPQIPGDSQFCKQLCDDRRECRREETYCRNCHGTGNFLLRDFFMTVGFKYVSSTESVAKVDLLSFLLSDSYVVIGPMSTYNYYMAVDDPDLLTRFSSLCGGRDVTPLVLLELDDNHVPTQFQYVLCDNQNETTILKMKVDKDVVIGKSQVGYNRIP